MGGVFRGSQIGNEDLSDAHGVLTTLSYVDWCFQVVLDLEFAGLSRDDLNDRHLINEFFWSK